MFKYRYEKYKKRLEVFVTSNNIRTKRSMKAVMLRDVEWVKKQSDLAKGVRLRGRPMKSGKRQHYLRIRKRAFLAIGYLALLAEMLPEDQQQQIFTREKLYNLIAALFNVREKSISKEKRLRILKLCSCALVNIGVRNNAEILASNSLDVIKKTGLHEYFDELIGIKAIMVEGVSLGIVKERPRRRVVVV